MALQTIASHDPRTRTPRTGNSSGTVPRTTGRRLGRAHQAHWYRLKHFLRWCDEKNITNRNSLTGRKLYEYRTWRRNDGDLNTVSLRTQLSTLRKFIRFCETIDGVEDGLYDSIVLPTLDEDVPKAVVSDRGDVSADVLDDHYNQMTKEEKMEQRRGYLEGL
ncbi:site-specific integrase [Halorussus litoreus]|uniref:site-specific integrase n=1 Tax=Halorussus litoreus TaxID=1710536 RepID=UPI000E259432